MKTEGRTRLRERHPVAAVVLSVTCLAFVVLSIDRNTVERFDVNGDVNKHKCNDGGVPVHDDIENNSKTDSTSASNQWRLTYQDQTQVIRSKVKVSTVHQKEQNVSQINDVLKRKLSKHTIKT